MDTFESGLGSVTSGSHLAGDNTIYGQLTAQMGTGYGVPGRVWAQIVA